MKIVIVSLRIEISKFICLLSINTIAWLSADQIKMATGLKKDKWQQEEPGYEARNALEEQWKRKAETSPLPVQGSSRDLRPNQSN